MLTHLKQAIKAATLICLSVLCTFCTSKDKSEVSNNSFRSIRDTVTAVANFQFEVRMQTGLTNGDDSVRILSSEQYLRTLYKHLTIKYDREEALRMQSGPVNAAQKDLIYRLLKTEPYDSWRDLYRKYSFQRDSIQLRLKKGVSKTDTAGYLHTCTFISDGENTLIETLVNKDFRPVSEIYFWPNTPAYND